MVFASLCCLSPVILVTFGPEFREFCKLFGGYSLWRLQVGLPWTRPCSFIDFFVVLLPSQQKTFASLDQAKRRKNEIINTVALTLIAAVGAYIFFLYVVVHYWGVWLKLWA